MSTITFLIILPIFLGLAIYLTWNYCNQRELPRTAEQLNDAKYFELKYKNEFLIALVILVSGVFAFLGYSTKKDLEEHLKSEITKELEASKDSISAFKDTLANVRNRFKDEMQGFHNGLVLSATQLDDFKQEQKTFSQNQKRLDEKSFVSESKIRSVSSRINEISNLNVLKKEFYILRDISVPTGSFSDNDNAVRLYKFYFKDLITNHGEKLPEFDAPPFLLVSPRNGGVLNITNVSKDGFEGTLASSSNFDGTGKEVFKFQVIVYN